MPYLICEKCDVYYEIDDEAKMEKFNSCDCGTNLVYSESLEEYYAKFEDPNNYERHIISHGSTHTEKEAYHAQNLINILEERESQNKNLHLVGASIILIGLFLGIFLSVFFLLLTFVGIFFVFYPKKRTYKKARTLLKNNSWVKGVDGEDIILNYLLSLHNEYDIFHDVKLPGKKGNIDHIVIGPTGIFVIETKNLTGNYRINGNQWYYKKSEPNSKYIKVRKNPGLQVLTNTIGLEKFLKNQGIPPTNQRLKAIVAFINPNLEIIKTPNHYNVLQAEMIPNFILNQKEEENIKLLEKTSLELKKHCTRSFLKHD